MEAAAQRKLEAKAKPRPKRGSKALKPNTPPTLIVNRPFMKSVTLNYPDFMVWAYKVSGL